MIDQLIIDGHVHIHDCFDLDRFLDGASANFSQVAHALAAPTYHGLLLLTESAGVDRFGDLYHHLDTTPSGPSHWRFEPTSETNSLRAQGPHGQALYLVAGRQIVTTEKLEVLGLGLVGDHPDGASLHQVMAAVKQAGGLPVLPWGFGKWSRSRGQLVQAVVAKREETDFFLGDNSNRPHFMPLPKMFATAAQRGIRNIPGSDPLPFKTETTRPGSYGLTLKAAFDPERPATSTLLALGNCEHTLQPYGQPERALRFCRNQVAMQIVKRTRNSRC